jgi:hypothetical protein
MKSSELFRYEVMIEIEYTFGGDLESSAAREVDYYTGVTCFWPHFLP